MKSLDLKLLEDGVTTGLSSRYGGFLAEGASVCLDFHQHPRNVRFLVDGDINERYELTRLDVTESAKDSFGDLDEAVEFGAMGLAIAIVNDQIGFVVKRSWKGTRFDFWAGDRVSKSRFRNRLKIEISGDLSGTDSELSSRLSRKLKQVQSGRTKLPSCAIVVEFSNPKSLVRVQ